jgi:threonine dehydratase
VSDAQLVDAMQFSFGRLKLVLEPGGAVALAALLAGAVQLQPGGRIGLMLSGRNVESARFCELWRRAPSPAAR